MKISTRKQQSRIQPGKTEPSQPKEECPACKIEYLENWYVHKKNKEGKWGWIVKGKYCPNDNCTFSRKDK